MPIPASYKKAFERDGYKCLSCGSPENLTIHHRLPQKAYPKLRKVVDNLVTLCVPCHSKYEKGLNKERSKQMIVAKAEGRVSEYERLKRGGLPVPPQQ